MGAILWSLNGTIRVMGWFHCHLRGYKVFRLSGCYSMVSCGGLQCQKTLGMLFLWSLSGTRGSCGGLQCHIRGFKGSGSAIQWSLNDSRGSWGGLQCHIRGYTGSRSVIQ